MAKNLAAPDSPEPGSRTRESHTPALALTAITKRFGATVALDGASPVVRRGTVHALLGEKRGGEDHIDAYHLWR